MQDLQRQSLSLSVSGKVITAASDYRLPAGFSAAVGQCANIESAVILLLIKCNAAGHDVFASYFTKSDVLSLQPLSVYIAKDRQRYANLNTLICVQISSLCSAFGVSYCGEPDVFASQIIDMDLTCLDLILFFAACRRREYVTEYESIPTRGIHSAFLLSWLDKYLEARDADTTAARRSEGLSYGVQHRQLLVTEARRQSVLSDAMPSDEPLLNIFNSMTARKAERAQIERKSRLLREASERGQMEQVIVRYPEGEKVELHYKQGALRRRLFELLYYFECGLDGERAAARLNELISGWRMEVGEDSDLLRAHLTASARSYMTAYMRGLRKVGAFGILVGSGMEAREAVSHLRHIAEAYWAAVRDSNARGEAMLSRQDFELSLCISLAAARVAAAT